MSLLPIYKNPEYSPAERAEDLLSRMTLREKIAQLDMKFGSKYCTEPDPNDNCSVTETTDYYWDKLREDAEASEEDKKDE